MEVLRLVTLARYARTHKILHHLTHVREVKITAESMERALDAFVPILVNGHHDLLDQRGRQRDVEMPPELNHAVDERPRGAAGPLAEFIPNGDESWVSVLRLKMGVDQPWSEPQSNQ